MNANPDDFDVVFVANATAAIKLVAECLAQDEFWYGYHKDAHTSLVGVRQLSREARCFASDNEVEEWIEGTNTGMDTQYTKGEQLKVFAYPAQSNMTGHRPPLSWSRRIRNRQANSYVLLDAASYLTSGYLDLSDYEEAPDFVVLSFYKIFGYPDLGALIVRRRAFEILRSRKYFGGGTVDMVIDLDDTWHASKTSSLHEVLEDGTLPFHNIIALRHALKVHQRLFGTRKQISQHTSHLSSWLATELTGLHYANGQSIVQLYLEKGSTYGNPAKQGPIIAFNILNSEGESIGKSKVEALAIACGIQLRSGGVCNPGESHQCFISKRGKCGGTSQRASDVAMKLMFSAESQQGFCALVWGP